MKILIPPDKIDINPQILISFEDGQRCSLLGQVCGGFGCYQCYYFWEGALFIERAKRALGSRENSRGLLLIDSHMAGRIGLKLGGMVEGMGENVLAKEFFGSVEVDQGQVSGPQVPLLGHGDDKETPNWACWVQWTGNG